MARLEIVQAEEKHVSSIAARMRAADVAEIEAATHKTPDRALKDAFELSGRCWTGMVDDTPAFMFGVYKPMAIGEEAVPWLLGTDDVLKVKKSFLMLCIPYLDEMRQGSRLLFNYVDARNTLSKRWLRWLGFRMGGAEPYGHRKMLFHRFEMEGLENV